MLSHATSVSNKQKKTEDKCFCHINILSILSSPSNKSDQNEVHAIMDLLQCSMSSTYRLKKKPSTRRGHLIAQVHNKGVK